MRRPHAGDHDAERRVAAVRRPRSGGDQLGEPVDRAEHVRDRHEAGAPGVRLRDRAGRSTRAWNACPSSSGTTTARGARRRERGEHVGQPRRGQVQEAARTSSPGAGARTTSISAATSRRSADRGCRARRRRGGMPYDAQPSGTSSGARPGRRPACSPSAGRSAGSCRWRGCRRSRRPAAVRGAQRHLADVVDRQLLRPVDQWTPSVSSRSPSAPTIACVVRVPCLSSSRAPGRSGFSASQHSGGVQLVDDGRGRVGRGDQVAAGDVDVVGQQHGDASARRRPRRAAPSAVSTGRPWSRTPAGSTTTSSPGATRARRRPARRSRGSRGARRCAGGSRTAPATGTARRVRVRLDRHRLQVPEQRRAVVPGVSLGALDDVVADAAPTPGSSTTSSDASRATSVSPANSLAIAVNTASS